MPRDGATRWSAIHGEVETPILWVALRVPRMLNNVWNADNTIQFWVDGALKATHNRAFTEQMRV